MNKELVMVTDAVSAVIRVRSVGQDITIVIAAGVKDDGDILTI